MKRDQVQLAQWLAIFLESEEKIGSILAMHELPKNLDDQAVALLHHHLLGPRAYRLLRSHNQLSCLSQFAQESLWRGYLANVQRHELYRGFIVNLEKIFANEGITAIAVKGLLFAERYYEVPEDRSFSDLDLVFPDEEKSKVLDIFFRNNFVELSTGPRFSANRHKVDLVQRDNRALVVECHFGLGHGVYQLKNFWQNSERGNNLNILSIYDEYSYLLYHGFVQHRLQKLGWLLDLAQMRRRVELRLEKIKEQVSSMKMVGAFDMSEYLLKRYAGIHIPHLVNCSDLDSWFTLIATGTIETNPFALARLRAKMYGSWWQLIRYASTRKWATKSIAKK